MSAEDMATTGMFTRSAYDRLLGYLNGMRNKAYRDLVLDMVLAPRSQLLDKKATQSFLASPAAGGKGHHSYPGGLPVHVLEWVEVAMGWADAYERVYKMESIDRDMVIAALTLHDWAKVWYVFNTASGKIEKPEWYPAAWGGDEGKAKWKWMGEHGVIVYAELMHRNVSEALVVATAATHFDPHWDLEKGGEGLNPALKEAADLAKKPPIVVKKETTMGEWFLSTYTDGAWSFGHYIAPPVTYDAVAEVAKDLGFQPDSREASMLAWFVQTRVSDFRIYQIYQRAGFKKEAAKNFVRSVIADSSEYEVPKR
ncbi:MAG: hypothetical protein HY057_10625 [Rhodospirillales bacterium]|nr:hypothetical protein [Rhodospirillales bacterium]